MKEAVSVVLVVIFLALGVCGGIYLGNHLVKAGEIVQWNWYQPSEGPDMGEWKKGSSGEGFAALIYIFFVVIGSVLGVSIGLCSNYLIGGYVWPLVTRMKTLSKVLVAALLMIGSCLGFHLGRTIVGSLMIIDWLYYSMSWWSAWRYQSSWGVVPLSITLAVTISGSALGLVLGLCIGYLIERCFRYPIIKKQVRQ